MSFPNVAETRKIMRTYAVPNSGTRVGPATFEAHVIDTNGALIVQRKTYFRARDCFIPAPGCHIATQKEYDEWCKSDVTDVTDANASVARGELFPLAHLDRFYYELPGIRSVTALVALIVACRTNAIQTEV